MPTIAEMELLDKSLGGLADTLQRNRTLAQQERERTARDDLLRQELELRRGEALESKQVRKASLESQMAHQQRLESLQKETNADKRAKMGLDFLADLNKNGQLTDEGIAAMEDKFNSYLGSAGLGVKLFQKGPANSPTPWEHPQTHRQYTVFGKSILNADQPTATITEKTDAMGGPMERTVRRPISVADLDKAMAETGAARAPGGSDGGEQIPSDEVQAPARGFLGFNQSRVGQRLLGPQEAQPGPDFEQAMRDVASGTRVPAGGPPPGMAPAGAPVPTAGQPAAPPKPAGKTDADILREAAAAIERNPAIADQVRARLVAWGLVPNR